MKALAGVAISLNPALISVVYFTPCLFGFGFATPPYAPARRCSRKLGSSNSTGLLFTFFFFFFFFFLGSSYTPPLNFYWPYPALLISTREIYYFIKYHDLKKLITYLQRILSLLLHLFPPSHLPYHYRHVPYSDQIFGSNNYSWRECLPSYYLLRYFRNYLFYVS